MQKIKKRNAKPMFLQSCKYDYIRINDAEQYIAIMQIQEA